MGTMNFSIPDDVKDKFNEIFKDENKSAIVTRALVREIVAEERRRSSESFLDRIRANLARNTRTYTEAEIRKAREDGRP